MKRALSHQEHLERLDSALSLENLTVAYGSRIALCDITLDIPSGEITAIIGPNNSGKTTLIKAILGLIKPVTGNIYIFARPNKGLKNDIGYIPCHTEVNWAFPTNVFDMTLTGAYHRIKLTERPGISDKELAAETLERVGLYEMRKKCISELTIGERQRVLLARAIMQNPRIFLADEPMIATDKKSMDIIINIFNELTRLGKTVIPTHHDILSIPKYFSKIVLLNVKTVCCGDCDDALSEENIKAAFGISESVLTSIIKDRR